MVGRRPKQRHGSVFRRSPPFQFSQNFRIRLRLPRRKAWPKGHSYSARRGRRFTGLSAPSAPIRIAPRDLSRPPSRVTEEDEYVKTLPLTSKVPEPSAA